MRDMGAVESVKQVKYPVEEHGENRSFCGGRSERRSPDLKVVLKFRLAMSNATRRITNKKWRDANKSALQELNAKRLSDLTEEFRSGKRQRAEQKKCSLCKCIKAALEFYLSNTNNDGLHGWCKQCSDRRTTENTRKRLFGVTPKDIAELYMKQSNACAICGVPQSMQKRRFSLDHCHATNKVRGLLCTSCNVLLGCVQDNPDVLKKAVVYLRKYHAK